MSFGARVVRVSLSFGKGPTTRSLLLFSEEEEKEEEEAERGIIMCKKKALFFCPLFLFWGRKRERPECLGF